MIEHEHKMISSQGIEMLNHVRRICANLPEVDEIIDGFGHTVFQVNGKSFIRMGEGGGVATMCFKSDLENQEILLQQGRFYRTPYIGQHGWVSINSPQDWDEMGELCKEAYLRAAPKRLIK